MTGGCYVFEDGSGGSWDALSSMACCRKRGTATELELEPDAILSGILMQRRVDGLVPQRILRPCSCPGCLARTTHAHAFSGRAGPSARRPGGGLARAAYLPTHAAPGRKASGVVPAGSHQTLARVKWTSQLQVAADSGTPGTATTPVCSLVALEHGFAEFRVSRSKSSSCDDFCT